MSIRRLEGELFDRVGLHVVHKELRAKARRAHKSDQLAVWRNRWRAFGQVRLRKLAHLAVLLVEKVDVFLLLGFLLRPQNCGAPGADRNVITNSSELETG